MPKKKSKLQQIRDFEKILKKAVKENQIDAETLVIAVHNVCAHGDIFKEHAPVTDKQLEGMFKGFDISIAATRDKKLMVEI
jgi:mRNA-degrading endonuclease YafQ of YafQ-DinJ toxin-antitoxin module